MGNRIITAITLMFAFFVLSRAPKQKETPVQKPKISAKQVFLNKTKDALKNFIKDKANNPDAMKISEMKVAFLCDSACALNFRFIAENRVGGHVNGKAQFILLEYQDEYYWSWQDDKDDSPHCIGDWLGNFGAFFAATLHLEFKDTDAFVKSKCPKDSSDCASITMKDEYVQAYCITKKFGEKADMEAPTSCDYTIPVQ